jgi:hypothetical protein
LAAIAVFAGSAILTIATYRNAANSVVEIREWHQQRDLQKRAKAAAVVVKPKPADNANPFSQFDELPSDSILDDEHPPYEVSPEPTLLLFGFLGGVLLLFVGRGIRYVLSAE